MVGKVEVVLYCHIVVLMQILNVRIEDITITTHVLLIQSEIYHKSVNKKLTYYLSSDNQKKLDAIFCSDNRKIE